MHDGSNMIYTPFHNAREEFRLLTVYAGLEHGDLRCSLRHEMVQGPSTYETVSYCWGSHEDQPVPLRVDGQVLHVPANAKAALERLRHHGMNRILWIDSVCINQRDLHERSMQVASMGTIYRKAIGNLIFLGHPPDGLAVNLTQVVSEASSRVKEARAQLNHTDEIGLMAGMAPRSWQHDNVVSTQSLVQLKPIFESAWFRRLWVVQEATLAASNTCFLGPFDFQLEDVLLLASINLKPTAYRGDSAHGFYAASYMRSFVMRDSTRRPPMVFRSFRPLVRSMLTTDPRDRIFAVLELFRAGLELDILPELLLPDYQKPVRNVYRDATRYCLSEANSSSLLSSICHRSEGDILLGFGSWTLRWNRQYSPNEDSLQLQYANAGIAHPESLHRQLTTAATVDENVLRLRGCSIGSVAWTSTLVGEGEPNYQNTSLIVDELITRTSEVAVSQTFGMDDIASLTADVLSTGSIGDHDYRFIDRNARTEASKAYIRHLKQEQSLPASILESTAEDIMEIAASKFHKLFVRSAHLRRCLQVDRGWVGIGPGLLREGDMLVVCEGAEHPYILRPSGTEHKFVGAAYVPGLMAGQAFHLNLESRWYDIR